jgi:hypothetical protein
MWCRIPSMAKARARGFVKIWRCHEIRSAIHALRAVSGILEATLT